MKTSQPRAFERETSERALNLGQKLMLATVLGITVISVVMQPLTTARYILACIMVFYVMFMIQKFVMQRASFQYEAKTFGIASVHDPDLPRYTIFVPLYKEANMLEKLVQALDQLRYPKDKLQIILLLEEDDDETRLEAEAMELGECYEIVLAPKGVLPKGKPKALNLGLAQATGALCVIYDAEDRPDPDQLLKAVAAFWSSSDKVACVQARLFFWNEESSWVTRCYWAEYVIHFEWVLPGLAKLGLVPPLGGTSNHFRTEVLRKIAIAHHKLPKGAEGVGGWDPYNVTEDAELAGALVANGYRVELIDSVTREEATRRVGVAIKQRRRWLKGYLQTGLAYTRHPFRTMRHMGPVKWFNYVLLMLGTPVSMMLNIIMWALTIAYFVTLSPVIESLFPPAVFYAGIALIVVGNLALMYQLFAACLHRGGFGSVKFMLAAPIWWVLTAWSAYAALWAMRPSKRHMWDKTMHGDDLHKEVAMEAKEVRLASNLDAV